MSKPTHPRRAKQKPRASKTSIVIKTLLILAAIIVAIATILKLSEFLVQSQKTEFPKLEFSLSAAPIEQISLDDKTIEYLNNTATFTIDNTISTFSNVEIKGRGNYTWRQPKKPYQIKLSEKASIFGFNPAKKWLLLANYTDPTYLRNDTAFYLEKLFDEPFALNGNFIDVYFDDHYHGLYYLTEKIEISKSRIDLQEPTSIIIELDNLYGDNCYYDLNANCITIKDSHGGDELEIAMAQFMDKLNHAEKAITSKNYKLLETFIDIDSFAKYFLLSEFSNNPDAYSSSLFMYYQNGKIFAGPGWDFDFAFGNIAWPDINNNATFILSPSSSMSLKQFSKLTTQGDFPETHHSSSISTLFFDLMDIPEFEARVKEIYQQTLSGKKDELLSHIRSQADYIKEAALRDQARWKLKTDFEEEVDYLIDWVAKRYDHFEGTYGASSNEADSSLNPAPESPQP